MSTQNIPSLDGSGYEAIPSSISQNIFSYLKMFSIQCRKNITVEDNNKRMSITIFINKWVLQNRAPISTQLHPLPPSSTQLHPAPSTPTQLILTSTQLHPPPPSSFKPPPRSLQHPQRYNNQNIERNWAISPNLDPKFKVVRFA